MSTAVQEVEWAMRESHCDTCRIALTTVLNKMRDAAMGPAQLRYQKRMLALDKLSSASAKPDSEEKGKQPSKESSTQSTITTGRRPEIVKKGFRFAPPEIRVMFFEAAFGETSWSIHSVVFPALLIALAKDKQLLREASAAFFKMTTIHVTLMNRVVLERRAGLRRIQKLVVHVSKCEWQASPSYSHSQIVAEATNVKDLVIDFATRTYKNDSQTSQTAIIYLNRLTKLTKFTIKVALLDKTDTATLSESPVIKRLNNALGFEGDLQYIQDESGRYPGQPDYIGPSYTCVWSAKSKEVLVWSPQNMAG